MITYCPRCGAPFAEEFRGEWFETGLRCAECAVTTTEPPLLLAAGDKEEEVDYDLAEWEPAERAAATTALLDVDIPYRWEQDLVLVVPAVAEEEVDLLLDELEEVEELDEEEDGDDIGGDIEAHTAMGDLFVAADRLQHDPTDVRMIADALEAELIVAEAAPPYGVERPVWRQIQKLASTLAGDLSEQPADDEAVAADARALREYLRDLV